ncbi:MAG: hypothetical protein DRP59_03695 [Spirochaetes bacterium]|nr:MAG: hypothetical protein DRP59_03695 [Spirochaetota bacterium]
MTRSETIKQLDDLDEYFRVHGWCTQMSQKIVSFMDGMAGNDRKYVQEWAYSTLDHKNIESASQILAIILLKLLDTDDKELIRILYTVLSGRLTYEDFNSLSLYIFKGKPPLSKDLFYNITERVFINKKTALLKALSVTSIISEADPELTIFYMTMLLCRVDLNNENRAMLNLLLYCIDADIPTEVAMGVRKHLLSIKDVLEEIFSSENSPEVQDVVEKVKIQMERESREQGFITIKSKQGEARSKEENASREDDFRTPADGENPVMTLEKPAVPKMVRNDAVETKAAEKKNGNVSKEYSESGNKVPKGNGESGGRKKPSPDTSGEALVIPSQSQKIKTFSNSVSKNTVTFPEGEKSIDSIKKSEKVKKNQSRGKSKKEKTGSSSQKAPESQTASSLPVESDEQYELKLRKFSLSDLVAGKTSFPNILKSKKYEKTNGSRKKYTMRILVWAAVFVVSISTSWFILNKKPVHTAIPVLPVPEKAVESAATKTQLNSTPPSAEASSGWKLKETDSGYEWTVQKGESVWKLHEYLSSHTSELPEPLQSAGEMDWIPFIKHIIALNPRKNFADFIEPGEVFLILRKK